VLVDDLIDAIAAGIESEYGHPIDELPWDEGDYLGDKLDTDDLLFNEGCDIQSVELRGEVISAFFDQLWCRKNYFRLRDDEALLAGWDRFVRQVLHSTRYVFLASPNRLGDEDPEVPTPPRTLEGIGNAVLEVGLVISSPPGTRWLRGRPSDPDGSYSDAASLGPAPKDMASTNRMSPAGIPMFYGAKDRATVLSELASVPQNSRHACVSVGTFVTTSEMRLLDLTSLRSLPRLWDAERRHLRTPIRFLTAFIASISSPIARDGKEHLDYVPSQVVTEWFRHVFLDEDMRALDGILYPSARVPGGTCCVLFIEREQCINVRDGLPDDATKLLGLESSETVIVHKGYRAFLKSPDLLRLRARGLEVLGQTRLFSQEEWNRFIWKPRSLEFERFVREECVPVAKRYDLYEFTVRRLALQGDYAPQLEPFAIGSDHPVVVLEVDRSVPPLFLEWLRFLSPRVGLRFIEWGDSLIAQLPLPDQYRPIAPLTDKTRPLVQEAFRVRIELTSRYPAELAAQIAFEVQNSAHELLRAPGLRG
jgi:hypothetical protein